MVGLSTNGRNGGAVILWIERSIGQNLCRSRRARRGDFVGLAFPSGVSSN